MVSADSVRRETLHFESARRHLFSVEFYGIEQANSYALAVRSVLLPTIIKEIGSNRATGLCVSFTDYTDLSPFYAGVNTFSSLSVRRFHPLHQNKLVEAWTFHELRLRSFRIVGPLTYDVSGPVVYSCTFDFIYGQLYGGYSTINFVATNRSDQEEESLGYQEVLGYLERLSEKV